MFDRCHAGAELLLKKSQEMAFYLVRHCAELGLKLAAYGIADWPVEHNLGALLNAIPKSYPVRGPSEDDRRFRSVLQEIARADKSGQAGRYPFLTSGLPVFDGLCHFPTDDLVPLGYLVSPPPSVRGGNRTVEPHW